MLITWSLVMMPYISKIVGQVLCIYTAIVLNWNTFQFHNTLFINSKCMHIPTFYVLNAAFLFVRPSYTTVNTWRPRQDCRHFPDYIFKQILLNQNVTIPNKLCINLFRKFPNDNKSILTHVMALYRIVTSRYLKQRCPSPTTHTCVTCFNECVNNDILVLYTARQIDFHS